MLPEHVKLWSIINTKAESNRNAISLFCFSATVPFIHTKNNVCKTWLFCVEARGPWSTHANRRQMLLSYDVTYSLMLLTLCAISTPFHLCSNTCSFYINTLSLWPSCSLGAN